MNQPLAPELQAMPPYSVQVWTDLGLRSQLLGALIEAWRAGESNALHRVIDVLDRSVRDPLISLGLHPGSHHPPRLDEELISALGQWDPRTQCLLLSPIQISAALSRPRGVDTIFRTWVHEYIHGRPSGRPTDRSEYRHFRGYEEGLSDGLADLIVRVKGGLDPISLSFPYYVTAYQTLATVLGLSTEELWLVVWKHGLGTVRSSFVDIVSMFHPLDARQRLKLRGIADTLFTSERARLQPNEEEMRDLWQRALR